MAWSRTAARKAVNLVSHRASRSRRIRRCWSRRWRCAEPRRSGYRTVATPPASTHVRQVMGRTRPPGGTMPLERDAAQDDPQQATLRRSMTMAGFNRVLDVQHGSMPYTPLNGTSLQSNARQIRR